MKRIEDFLCEFGCTNSVTIQTTVDRFLGDDDFYFSTLKELVNAEEFDNLKRQLDKHDKSAAFEAAHALKGVISNYSIPTAYEMIVRIVEQLRTDKPDYQMIKKDYKRLMDEMDKVKNAVAEM